MARFNRMAISLAVTGLMASGCAERLAFSTLAPPLGDVPLNRSGAAALPVAPTLEPGREASGAKALRKPAARRPAGRALAAETTSVSAIEATGPTGEASLLVTIPRPAPALQRQARSSTVQPTAAEPSEQVSLTALLASMTAALLTYLGTCALIGRRQRVSRRLTLAHSRTPPRIGRESDALTAGFASERQPRPRSDASRGAA
jgi:hypothetical protein